MPSDKNKNTRSITTRFFVVANYIIANAQMSGTGPKTMRDFAESIKSNPSNFSNYQSDDGRNVTLEMCYQLAKKYGVDMNWLMLGKGVMFADAVEERLKKLEKEVFKK